MTQIFNHKYLYSQLLMCTNLFTRLAVTAVLALSIPALAKNSEAPKFLIAHHVHLKGSGGNNEVNRHQLQIDYQACVRSKSISGRYFKTLPDGGIPNTILSESVDIYYAENQTLSNFESKLFVLNYDDCGLDVVARHNATLNSKNGSCEIDFMKKTAKGICNANAPANVRSSENLRPSAFQNALKNIPPEKRALIESQFKNKGQIAADLYTTQLQRGEVKMIARTECQLYQFGSAGEKCVANPPSPFSIPSSPLHFAVPGILLSSRTNAMTLEADEVNLNQEVNLNLFEVPEDFRVINIDVDP